MKHSFKFSAILSIGLFGIGGSAYATQPPDVVTSDTLNNTAMGTNALLNNAGGYDNLAIGVDPMYANTSGNSNVAVGNSALTNNLDGNGNFALGTGALVKNIHGCYNVAIGPDALYNVNGAAPSSACASGAQGSKNIAIGLSAGSAIVTGSNNIDIGVPGLSTDNGVTRIGGIYGVAVSGTTMPVVVNSSGQLGVAPSSSSGGGGGYGDMPPMSNKLGRLAPILLSAIQRQQRINAAQAAEIRHLKEQQQNQLVAQTAHAAAQDAQIRDLKKMLAEMQAGLARLQAKDTLVAQR